jgi:hypothetical protein
VQFPSSYIGDTFLSFTQKSLEKWQAVAFRVLKEFCENLNALLSSNKFWKIKIFWCYAAENKQNQYNTKRELQKINSR